MGCVSKGSECDCVFIRAYAELSQKRDLRCKCGKNSDLGGNQRLQQGIRKTEPKVAAIGHANYIWGDDGILGIKPNKADWPQKKLLISEMSNLFLS